MSLTDEILTIFETKKSFLAHIHLSPDADAIGSALALKLALENEGKQLYLFGEDPLIDSARFLPAVEKIELTSLAEALKQPHDIYICLDTAKWSLSTRNSHHLIKAPVLVIDHHPENNLTSKLKWVNPNASSTSRMIYELMTKLKWPVTAEIASCLLYGLMGDTGLFQHTNTTASDLSLAAKLVKLGANYDQVVLNLARSYNPGDLECIGTALTHLKSAPDGSYAWIALGNEVCAGIKGKPKLGFIANQYAGRINGTYFGAILIEKESGVTKGSLRSRVPEFDVSAIARRLGGGGHRNAASFKLNLPLAAAEKKFLAAVRYVTKTT